jgi:hypothetical protein
MRVHRLLSAAAIGVVAACSSVTGSDEPEYERRPGLIASSIEGEEQVQVPAAGNVGQLVVVRVTTLGGGCRRVAQPGGEVNGLTANVEIWELFPADGACTRDLKPLEHLVQVRFLERGTAVIRVHGLSESPTGQTQPIVVERTLTIR